MARVVMDTKGLADLLDPGGGIANDMLLRASRVLAAQKRMVPVDTGNLLSSLDADVESDGVTWHIGSTGQGFDRTTEDYVLVVEFGDPSNPSYPAQPFMRPSLNAARDGAK